MNLVNYEPFKALNRLQEEMANFFHTNDQLAQRLDDSDIATSQWLPAVDVKDEETQFVIQADIPGVDPQDIEVRMDNGMITIKGERQSESKDEKEGYRRVERRYGSFYRRFSLPDTADPENIQASGKNGVLEITIPKKKSVSKAKRIKINT